MPYGKFQNTPLKIPLEFYDSSGFLSLLYKGKGGDLILLNILEVKSIPKFLNSYCVADNYILDQTDKFVLLLYKLNFHEVTNSGNTQSLQAQLLLDKDILDYLNFYHDKCEIHNKHCMYEEEIGLNKTILNELFEVKFNTDDYIHKIYLEYYCHNQINFTIFEDKKLGVTL